MSLPKPHQKNPHALPETEQPPERRHAFPTIVDIAPQGKAQVPLWSAPVSLAERLRATWATQRVLLRDRPAIDKSLLWIFVGILAAAVLVKFGMI